jgi:hypothetical protein
MPPLTHDFNLALRAAMVAADFFEAEVSRTAATVAFFPGHLAVVMSGVL